MTGPHVIVHLLIPKYKNDAHTVYTRYASVFFLQDQEKDYVGFATLPNQVHRKTVKKGFTFTLIVAGESSHMSAEGDAVLLIKCYRVPFSAGESGLGKSTLINSLFLTDLYKDRKVPNAEGEMGSSLFLLHSI